MARIALDAMGGDFAPQATVAGALLALGELDPRHTVQLVGRSSVVREQLDALLVEPQYESLRAQCSRVEIVDAPDVIEMTDKPAAVIRGKPNSSMLVGLKLQAEGKSDAFVSAGNTGAQMAASMVVLRLHAGVKRPAIATLFPTGRKPVVVLDSGANVDCSADELVQFARLGVVYAEDLLGRENPAVGLLSIGEEPEKGNAVVEGSAPAAPVGRPQLPRQRRGARPTRGQLATAVRSTSSSATASSATSCSSSTRRSRRSSSRMLVKAGVDEKTIIGALKQLDYSEHGGAPLLGVDGVSIISHGKSSPRAIKNAIKVAVQAVETRMNEHIGRHLA